MVTHRTVVDLKQIVDTRDMENLSGDGPRVKIACGSLGVMPTMVGSKAHQLKGLEAALTLFTA